MTSLRGEEIVRTTMKTGCRFVQISDLHLWADRHRSFHHVNPYQHLMRAIALIDRLTPPPDFVLVNGDLVNEETEEAYAVVADAMRWLRYPVYYALGNHDNRELFGKVMGDEHRLPSGAYAYSFCVHDCRSIVLDTLQSGEVRGYISTEQLAWCEDILRRDTRPTLLFLHHAPLPVGIPWIDALMLEGAQTFLRLVESYAQVRGVFSGHVHRYHVWRRGHTLFATSPPLSVRFGPDPEAKVVPGRVSTSRSHPTTSTEKRVGTSRPEKWRKGLSVCNSTHTGQNGTRSKSLPSMMRSRNRESPGTSPLSPNIAQAKS